MKRTLLLIALLTSFGSAWSTSKFEPADGKVLYGMGQELHRFYIVPEDNAGTGETKAGIDAVRTRSGRPPLLLSGYTGVGPVANLAGQFDQLRAINATEGTDYQLLLGVSMHDVELFESLFNGGLDAHLHAWGAYLRDVTTNVFIRPLYEINEGDHIPYVRGYAERHNLTPGEVGASAFRAIVDKIREGAGVPLDHVAWMWHPYPLDYGQMMGFYPGDAYVDWLGVSWFTFDSTYSHWETFMPDMNRIAEERDKPIMVAESGPSWAWETLTDFDVIRLYFEPYFDLMEQYPRVKAFVYINVDWTIIAWLNWADLRLPSRPEALEYFSTRLLNPAYDVSAEVFSLTPSPIPTPSPTPLPCPCSPGTGRTFVEKDRRVVIEAENYYGLEKRADSTPWTFTNGSPGHSCAGAMEAPTAASNADWETGARMVYRFRIDTPGYYSVKLRRNSELFGSSGNSCFVGIDGAPLSGGRYDNQNEGQGWLWMRNGKGFIQHLDAGYHTLEIVRREKGYRVDRIMISGVGLPGEGSPEPGPCESAVDETAPTPTPLGSAAVINLR